jgi:uridine kinase
MRAVVLEKVPLLEEWWTIEEAREHFEHEGATAVTALLKTWRDAAVPLVSYGSAYALRNGPLLPDTGELTGFRVVTDGDVLLLVYGNEAAQRPLPSIMAPAAVETNAPRVLTEVDRAFIVSQAQRASRHAAAMTVVQEGWLEALGITSVGTFNDSSINGNVSQLIFVNEGYQEKRISQIADEIAAHAEDMKIVCIAGPSSSGKTTFIRRLKTQLQVNGIQPAGIGLDDYYVDREETPRDEAGAFDFEAFEALRMDLLQEHLGRLLAGEQVRTAHYDFQKGTSHPVGGPEMRLGPRDLLLLEGIHGLNPMLLAEVDTARVFRVFVCPLAQLPFDALSRVHASDVRLIRRLVRDRHARAIDAATTIQRWPSVRAGERRHIFPYQHHADAVFDSSLVYELGVLRVFAERYLLEVAHEDPATVTAFRLLTLLDRFVAIYPDHVPPTSILREFIGGSGFVY